VALFMQQPELECSLEAIGQACAHRLTYDQPAIHSPGLPFNDLHPVIRVITWITTHLLTPEEWKAELA